MKVLFQQQGLITETYKSLFRNELPEDIELIFTQDREPSKFMKYVDVGDIDVFIGYYITKEFLENAKNLKHIQVPWTGFNRMNTELLQEYSNITVSNSHSNSLAIAEHAVALLFSAAKLIVYRDSKMRDHDWSPRRQEDNSFWISGRKLSVIGYGAIGKKVARMLKHGFEMDVMAIKRHPEEPDEICEFIGGPDDLDDVLKQSDFVVVATPLTEETRGMLHSENLQNMKSTAVLVNIARGEIIEEEALYNILKEERIGAAGIDTWYNYPSGDDNIVQQNFPFEELDNIVMSPHSAFKVREREEEFAQDILENIRRMYNGDPPINQVNLSLGY